MPDQGFKQTYCGLGNRHALSEHSKVQIRNALERFERLYAHVDGTKEIRVWVVGKLAADLLQVCRAQSLQGVQPVCRPASNHCADHRECQRQIAALRRDCGCFGRQFGGLLIRPPREQHQSTLFVKRIQREFVGTKRPPEPAITGCEQQTAPWPERI